MDLTLEIRESCAVRNSGPFILPPPEIVQEVTLRGLFFFVGIRCFELHFGIRCAVTKLTFEGSLHS